MPQIEETTTTSDRPHVIEMKVRQGINLFAMERDLLGERVELAGYFPEQLFRRFLDGAIKRVEPKRLETGQWFIEIPGFVGVWASNIDLGVALQELREILTDWVLLKVGHRDRDIPLVDGINLNIIG